ncbi:MAG: NYN domain-containing protein [Roseiflexaceae bacterium]|nr:NYN domain-containing protein [Roseiflexaceae bacterium]
MTYFSAYAKHRIPMDADVINRHKKYINCLEDTGVTIELGRFKNKPAHCPHCHALIERHEEKETDVTISVRLLELFVTDQCDTAVVITGDTDIAPAIRAAKRLFPTKQVGVGLPYQRLLV